MKATDFEVRNKTLLHLLVVGAAFGMYAFQPDDIVWAAVKGHAERILLERIVFAAGTLLIFFSATVDTWARLGWHAASDKSSTQDFGTGNPNSRYLLYVGRLVFALGIGLLAPAIGTAVLLIGEAILVSRLLLREQEIGILDSQVAPNRVSLPGSQQRGRFWVEALRREASKWGLAVTMVVFTYTLKDRLAELLAAVSFLLWAALNLPELIRSRGFH